MAVENRLTTVRLLVILIGLLYSDIIGPETLPKGRKAELALSSSTAPRPLGKTEKKTEMTPERFDRLDKRAFLSAFFRQSQLGLNSCLGQSNLESKSFALRARLSKLGYLEDLQPVEIVLPDCAEQIIKGMSFSHLTKTWRSPSKIIYWRIEW